ncbi:hypothetical protein ACWIBQ_08125 [Microbacterium keratanolyticum]
MSDDLTPEHDEPDLEDFDPAFDDDADELPEPPHPINWDLLSPSDAEHEWLTLNEWVHWLRKTYGLPAAIIPPLWHRHRELVWELSALHLHWLGAYDAEQDGSAPLGWHADFALARERLREWVTISGTRLDRDRPTRQTTWPGEEAADDMTDTPIADREEDFYRFVTEDIARRRQLREELRALRGEVPDRGHAPDSSAE